MSNRGTRSLANWDLPFHDYHLVTSQSTDLFYAVGTNNLGQGKDQKKLFVSKCTLIYCTEDTNIRFNNSNNVIIAIVANTWYTFYSNIYSVFYPIPNNGKILKMYFEGVLPQDTGVAEA